METIYTPCLVSLMSVLGVLIQSLIQSSKARSRTPDSDTADNRELFLRVNKKGRWWISNSELKMRTASESLPLSLG